MRMRRGTYLLAHVDLSRSEVAALESREEELGRRHVVAVGAQLQQRNLEGVQEALRPLRGVIGGVVPDDDGVLAPVLVLAVQRLHQLREEDLHGLGVVVLLQEADEDLAEAVDAGDERDPGADDELLFSRGSSSGLPATSLIPDGVQPGLVDVDEPPLRLVELEEDEGTLLATD